MPAAMTHESVRAFMASADYESRILQAISATDDKTGLAAVPITHALGVFLLSPKTRELLANNDPKAVAQALRAIGIELDR